MEANDNLFEEQQRIIRIMERRYTKEELEILYSSNEDVFPENIEVLSYFIARGEIQHIAFRSKIEEMPLYINDKNLLIKYIAEWRLKIKK